MVDSDVWHSFVMIRKVSMVQLPGPAAVEEEKQAAAVEEKSQQVVLDGLRRNSAGVPPTSCTIGIDMTPHFYNIRSLILRPDPISYSINRHTNFGTAGLKSNISYALHLGHRIGPGSPRSTTGIRASSSPKVANGCTRQAIGRWVLEKRMILRRNSTSTIT